jgi:hypothetical protein
LRQIPIACTLSAVDRTNRDDEWRQFLDASVVEFVRSDSSARLRLIGGEDVVLTAVV